MSEGLKGVIVSNHKSNRWSRREFLSTAAIAGAGAVLGLRTDGIAAEAPPETNKLRIGVDPGGLCSTAPKLMAEDSLKGEGFSDLQYVQGKGGELTRSSSPPARLTS